MGFIINITDLKKSLVVSLFVSLFMAGICLLLIIINNSNAYKELLIAYNTVQETLSAFSVTFLGFIITSFTVFQIMHSKSWFEKIINTETFDELLGHFKLLMIISGCGIFIALSLRISVSLLINKWLLIAGVWLAAFIIAFLCSFAWKTISAIIGIIKK